jgi:hypothetical protein
MADRSLIWTSIFTRFKPECCDVSIVYVEKFRNTWDSQKKKVFPRLLYSVNIKLVDVFRYQVEARPETWHPNRIVYQTVCYYS